MNRAMPVITTAQTARDRARLVSSPDAGVPEEASPVSAVSVSLADEADEADEGDDADVTDAIEAAGAGAWITSVTGRRRWSHAPNRLWVAVIDRLGCE